MKRNRIGRIFVTLCLILGMLAAPAGQMRLQAAEIIATVSGTILTGTTSEVLLLSTKEGKMEIKLDSSTDASGCKILLPNKEIIVSVSRGSDGYLHAVKITGTAQTGEVSVDTSSSVTVSGTLGDKTTDELLYLNTSQGEMQIKLDTTTDISGCTVLVKGKTYYVTCARGSDAYMHAVRITDTNTTATATTSVTATATYPPVMGTVANGTTDTLLYLSTSGGVYQLVIDSSTDTSKGMVLIPGLTLTVSFYRGSDAYLHASAIAGVKDNASAVTLNSSVMTVTGTVGSSSTENILYLSTSAGTMELKLDCVSSMNNCKVLTSGKKITVTCARGSDAYLHVTTITGV